MQNPNNPDAPEGKENLPIEPSSPDNGGAEPDPKKHHRGGQIGYVFSLIFTSFRELFFKFINIQDSTDVRKTIQNIHGGIELKGYNIWILIASAVLACIGLDQNSGAVIIGAMLISPLMSPILGIGLGVGMNDRQTLLNSLYNFGVAVAISMVTAFIYFSITPLGQPTTEILARTQPNILDASIGFFGGVAGIVAGSRREMTNAIPGVAIATALMPPLCTAGFGLATFRFEYFAGAFYLFFLNVVFISLSTFLIVRFLHFPLKAEVTLNLRKTFLRGVVVLVAVILVPAVWIFIETIHKARTESRVQVFLQEKFPNEDFSVERHEMIDRDSCEVLKITVAGTQYIPQDTIDYWQKQLPGRYNLKNTELKLIQTKSDPRDVEKLLGQVQGEIARRFTEYQQDRENWLRNQEEIARLRQELEAVQAGKLPITNIRDEIQAFTPEILALSLGEIRVADLSKPESRQNVDQDENKFWVMLTWKDTLDAGVMEDRKSLLKARLKDRYNLQNVEFVDMNKPFIDYGDPEN